MRVRPRAPVGPAPPATSNERPAGSPRARSFTAVLGDQVATRAAPATTPPPPRPAPAGARKPPATSAAASPSPVRAMLERTLSAERRVDTLLAAAASGKTFSPAELLALQQTVFRYSQAVEVVSRATDKLVGAVKQTMGTQV